MSASPPAAAGTERLAAPPLRAVSSWGRLSQLPHETHALSDRTRLPLPATRAPALPFGTGRSYGDSCLNSQGALWLMRGLDRFIAFDPDTGVLECEAGVLLDDIISTLLPRGWFLPVTPGTRYVTLGGAVANDVHGKNHHRAGTLGHHVLGLTLLRTDGTRIECSPTAQADWLSATIGGLGLTGVITSVRLQMLRVRGAWIDGETLPFGTLADFFALSAQSEASHDYIVSWIDCVHGGAGETRGVFFRGNHAAETRAAPASRTRSLPLTPPVSLVNRLSLRAFNSVYFRMQQARAGRRREHLLPFFYPLDGLLGWNRIYGPRGFYQYQCVVPRAVQAEATAELLAVIRHSGRGSFLAVLKTFGDRPNAGMLSFPMAGTTLALDSPNEGAVTEALFQRLDAVVREAGGRLYPAKDARMPRELFLAGHPRLAEFQRYRDPGIASDLSRRLLDA